MTERITHVITLRWVDEDVPTLWWATNQCRGWYMSEQWNITPGKLVTYARDVLDVEFISMGVMR